MPHKFTSRFKAHLEPHPKQKVALDLSRMNIVWKEFKPRIFIPDQHLDKNETNNSTPTTSMLKKQSFQSKIFLSLKLTFYPSAAIWFWFALVTHRLATTTEILLSLFGLFVVFTNFTDLKNIF